MKAFPDKNWNSMTPSLFILLAIYCWLNGFAIALMFVLMLSYQ